MFAGLRHGILVLRQGPYHVLAQYCNLQLLRPVPRPYWEWHDRWCLVDYILPEDRCTVRLEVPCLLDDVAMVNGLQHDGVLRLRAYPDRR